MEIGDKLIFNYGQFDDEDNRKMRNKVGNVSSRIVNIIKKDFKEKVFLSNGNYIENFLNKNNKVIATWYTDTILNTFYNIDNMNLEK